MSEAIWNPLAQIYVQRVVEGLRPEAPVTALRPNSEVVQEFQQFLRTNDHSRRVILRSEERLEEIAKALVRALLGRVQLTPHLAPMVPIVVSTTALNVSGLHDALKGAVEKVIGTSEGARELVGYLLQNPAKMLLVVYQNAAVPAGDWLEVDNPRREIPRVFLLALQEASQDEVESI